MVCFTEGISIYLHWKRLQVSRLPDDELIFQVIQSLAVECSIWVFWQVWKKYMETRMV